MNPDYPSLAKQEIEKYILPDIANIRLRLTNAKTIAAGAIQGIIAELRLVLIGITFAKPDFKKFLEIRIEHYETLKQHIENHKP